MTYEEISKKYPIGKLLARTKNIENKVGYWIGLADKEYYVNNYTNVYFHDNGYVRYTEISFKEYRVEGWIVTDEGFSLPSKPGMVGSLLTKKTLMKLRQKAYYMNFNYRINFPYEINAEATYI